MAFGHAKITDHAEVYSIHCKWCDKYVEWDSHPPTKHEIDHHPQEVMLELWAQQFVLADTNIAAAESMTPLRRRQEALIGN